MSYSKAELFADSLHFGHYIQTEQHTVHIRVFSFVANIETSYFRVNSCKCHPLSTGLFVKT